MSLYGRRERGGLVRCDQASCRRTLPGLWRVRSSPQYEPHLFVGQGWQPDANGVWRVTEYARHDADFMAGRHGDARRHVRTHHTVQPDDESVGWTPDLPVRVVCPHCQSLETLRADILRVRAVWPTHWRPCLEPGCVALGDGADYCDKHLSVHPEWVKLPPMEYASASWRVSD